MNIGDCPAVLGQELIPLFFRGFVSSRKSEESQLEGGFGSHGCGWRLVSVFAGERLEKLRKRMKESLLLPTAETPLV